MSEFNGKIFVPSNIKNNKQAIFWKLDIRNISYIILGLIIFSVFFLPFKATNNTTFGMGLGLLFSTPFFLISFIKIKGLNIEEFVTIFKVNKLSSGSVRINDIDNLYEILEKKKILAVDKKNNNFNIKNLLTFNYKKNNEVKETIVDTDDNLIKIQNIENVKKSTKVERFEKGKVLNKYIYY